MLRLSIILISILVIVFFAWFVLKKTPIIKQSRALFWVLTSFTIFVVLVTSTMAVGFHFENRAPPEPKITYGVFPFRFEYEIEDERFVIEDTVIVNFRGSFRGNMTTQPSRRWDMTLLSGEGYIRFGQEYRFVLKECNNMTIVFNPGLAKFFMSDPIQFENSVASTRIQPHISVRNPNNNQNLYTIVIVEDARGLLAEHGITLISWEYTPPIKNSFG